MQDHSWSARSVVRLFCSRILVRCWGAPQSTLTAVRGITSEVLRPLMRNCEICHRTSVRVAGHCISRLPLVFSTLSRQGTLQHSSSHRRTSDRLHCVAGERTGTSKAESQLRKLKDKLKRAVRTEDYSAAASLRDSIRQVQAADPVLRLKGELEDAIEAQNFEAAAQFRDELKRLAPPPKPRIPISAPPPTTSDTVTNGVRVQVKSSFLPHRSNPGSYFFMYRIRIRNESESKIVKLHSRHWIITDANYHQDVVRGLGVIGEQPELQPGEEHVYGSYCPIRTPTGKMKGSFRMQVRNPQGEWGDEFDADIGVFGLDMSDASPASW